MSTEAPHPEIHGFSIVALGSFNPAIFQPLWFSDNNLIRHEEAENLVRPENTGNAKLGIIHPDVSVFSTEWFSLQVTDNRFCVETADPTKSQTLRDLVQGTFRILEHTPIHAFGFNGNYHFRVSNEDWHDFGHHYAPKDSWNGILTDPGMRSLIIEGTRENCKAERLQIRIEPSPNVHPGVYVQVNQHYRVSGDQETSTKDRMVEFLHTLKDSWDDFAAYCDRACKHLLTQYKQED